jgi:hypothetical protein
MPSAGVTSYLNEDHNAFYQSYFADMSTYSLNGPVSLPYIVTQSLQFTCRF